MKIYEPAAQIIEHALLKYEEHPDKFIPNSSSTIEDNINSIIPETDVIDDSYKFLIPDDNTEMNNYDLQQDLKIQKYNYIDSIQTKPNILDNTELIKLINSLKCKQYEFFLYIMQQQLHKQRSTNISLFTWWSWYRKILCIESYISRLKQNIKPETWTTNK